MGIEKILGVEHPNYLKTKNNIALVLLFMGQYQKSLDSYNECLTLKEKIFGVEHPSSLVTKQGIAQVYQRMGQYQKALDQYHECLTV